MTMTRFVGYAPDLDPSTAGVLTSVSNLVPSFKGMRGAPEPVNAGFEALAKKAQGFAVATKLDGSRRIFAGTVDALYEGLSGAWTDRSAGGGYSIGADGRWVFSQFGDVTLAANKAQTIQYSSSGAFAAISGAPKSRLIAVSQGFVMAANTNDAGFGDQSDRWWCSAYLDYSDWTLNVATQCVSGRLVDSPGPIYALKALGAAFVAYKKDSIFVASYVGAPSVWNWTQIPGYVGVTSESAVVDVGYAHIFIGMEDIYEFDGTRPVAIGNGIREWFFAHCNPAYLSTIQGAYDQTSGNVYWFFTPNSSLSGAITAAIIYNVKTKRWGKYSLTIEAVCMYVSAGITYNGLGSTYTNYDDLPTTISYDSPFWTAESPVIAVFQTDHIAYSLTGASVSSSMSSGNIGDDTQFSTLRRIKYHFTTDPVSATAEILCDNAFGNSFTTYDTISMTNSTFDTLVSARWHKLNTNFSGPVEILGATYDLVPDGTE